MLISSLLATITFTTFASKKDDNENLRDLFDKVDSEEDLDDILEYQTKMKGTISEAYFGSVIVMKAQYPFSPIKKIKYYSEGTKFIEKSISTKKVIENTYLRLLIQLNTPRFLGYYQNIQEDITFIEQHIDTCTLSNKWRITLLEQIMLFEDEDYNYQVLKDKLAKYKTP